MDGDVSPTRAFAAMESGLGLTDLELAVSDRLEDADLDERKHRALVRLRSERRRRRRGRGLRFHSRAIIEVERAQAVRRISRTKYRII